MQPAGQQGRGECATDSGRPVRARRLFAGVAVAAPGELRHLLAALQRELRGERVRWTRLEKLHLTVEFFGETAEARIPGLAAALAQAAADSRPFPVQLGGWGVFGGRRNPRVVWLGVASDGLRRLHEHVQARLRAVGWSPEARPFAPHLTLGRLDRLRNPADFQARLAATVAPPLPAQEIRELILYESAAGQYPPLARWPLSGT